MKKAFVRFLAVLGAIWLLTLVVMLLVVAVRKGRVPSKTILEANFERQMVEDIPDQPAAQALLSVPSAGARRGGCPRPRRQ